MKNSLGNPARGDAFFNRGKQIEKIYKVLETGSSIYLSAPRRVGKTSILKHLEEFPNGSYHFIYIITESLDVGNDFFKTVFEELIKSDAIKRLSKVSNSIREIVSNLLCRVKSFSDVEFREGEEPDYYELLVELFTNIESDCGRLVLMIDEFPQTIQNIMEKEVSGRDQAQKFLQKNRELRLHKNFQEKINFIYTGSVSLFPMVEKVTSLTSINDLRTVEVEPLEAEEAKTFLNLLLENEGLELDAELLDYIIDKIRWLIPFHLQLIQQEIVDVCESTKKPIEKSVIDKAFEQIVHSRNKPQFAPYFSRLSKIFKTNEHEFVITVLKQMAEKDTVTSAEIHDLGVKHSWPGMKATMEILESDGYLFRVGDTYRYASPILQLWCKKHICP